MPKGPKSSRAGASVGPFSFLPLFGSALIAAAACVCASVFAVPFAPAPAAELQSAAVLEVQKAQPAGSSSPLPVSSGSEDDGVCLLSLRSGLTQRTVVADTM